MSDQEQYTFFVFNVCRCFASPGWPLTRPCLAFSRRLPPSLLPAGYESWGAINARQFRDFAGRKRFSFCLLAFWKSAKLKLVASERSSNFCVMS